MKIVNDVCPFKKSKYTNSRPPWITHELMELAKDRDYFMTLARRKPTEDIVQRAKALRNEAKSAFKRAKEEFVKSRLEEHQDNPKEFWQELANVIPTGHQLNSNIILNDENWEVLSKDNTPNYVNDYFSTIGQKLLEDIRDLMDAQKQTINKAMDQNPQQLPLIEIVHFSLEDVIRQINKIDIYKASGMPEISSRIVKHAFSVIPDRIQHLFNCSLRRGIFTKAWKHGTVIPIPKIHNPNSPSDLRPVILLPIPGKMMEHLVHEKLSTYLEENRVISCEHNGFRKNHVTKDTIFKLLNHIFDNLNKRKSTLATFIDFKKAFDTLDHNILQSKLQNLSLSRNLFQLLCNYLSDRSQHTYINNACSDI